jgi:hypothetical protein
VLLVLPEVPEEYCCCRRLSRRTKLHRSCGLPGRYLDSIRYRNQPMNLASVRRRGLNLVNHRSSCLIRSRSSHTHTPERGYDKSGDSTAERADDADNDSVGPLPRYRLPRKAVKVRLVN